MKKILLFIIFISFISCSDNNDEVTIDDSLVGEWVLTDVICFCGFENADFSTHKLIFDSIVNKVTVVNDPDTYYFHISGNFRYSNQESIINLEDSPNSYSYQLKGNVLQLTYIDDPMIADDEVTYRYIKK